MARYYFLYIKMEELNLDVRPPRESGVKRLTLHFSKVSEAGPKWPWGHHLYNLSKGTPVDFMIT